MQDSRMKVCLGPLRTVIFSVAMKIYIMFSNDFMIYLLGDSSMSNISFSSDDFKLVLSSSGKVA